MAFETINLGTQPAGTGGDTARSAFEKTNRNFLAADVLSAAMSQAQFEAIRAQNNEEFAASGFVHFGNHQSNTSNFPNVNNGLWCVIGSDSQNKLYFGRGQGSIGGTSKTNFPIINIAGVIFSVDTLSDSVSSLGWSCHAKFPQAPDGKTTYNKSTGVITNHATVTAAFNAQAADPTNVDVVTDRVDMWGFEAWLEEVNTTNPYIYPNGLIQSQATTMNGIATSASARPVTYYAVFDGDTGSKGKGLNFFALTDAQKKKVLANPKNNLYYLDDGRLVQWRLRQRTIAGAGNGNWFSVDAPNPLSAFIGFDSKSRIAVQGILNTVGAYSTSASSSYNTTNNIADHGVRGVDAALGSNKYLNFSAAGECYFLVCGTVNRLNQGAYHPSFNPSGSRNLKYLGQDSSGLWYSQTYTPTQLECFTIREFGENQKGAYRYSGYIGSTSGRPDGRFYDAIYADGQGGVCRDMRYSAYGVDSVDFATTDQKVKNGTYRGFEKLMFTDVETVNTTLGSNINYIRTEYPSKWSVGDRVYCVDVGNNILVNGTVTAISGNNLSFNGSWSRPVKYYLIGSHNSLSSVGGSFLQTDVIGNPENILATPALANGWQGSWIPAIPEGAVKDYPLARKNIGGTPSRTYTTNNGVSWFKDTMPNFDALFNGAKGWSATTANIYLFEYQAFSKQTENAVNAVVYGWINGIGELFSACYYQKEFGSLFQESLIGKVNISDSTQQGDLSTNYPLISLNINASDSKINNISSRATKHSSLGLVSPSNNSPAFKALSYNVNLNQQAFIQYAYTELKHNGSSWGDDGKVTIVDNQSTKTDLNGNTVLVGTAKLKEPIGWIKNKV